MKNLFSESGLKFLESLTFARALYAFDFDGTLAKIVPNPSDAAMSAMTDRLLRRLNEIAPVAVISGRSIRDLRDRLGFSPRMMVGNHGLEGLSSSMTMADQIKEAALGWKKSIQSMEHGSKGLSDMIIEDKGYSLALHYRQSRNKKIAKVAILNAVAQLLPPPRVIMGKSVVNLVPAGGPHKGVALMELMVREGLKAAFYIGDDDTDEDVFGLPVPGVMTVRVGQKKESQAQYFIERQKEINQVLKGLIQFHEKK